MIRILVLAFRDLILTFRVPLSAPDMGPTPYRPSSMGHISNGHVAY